MTAPDAGVVTPARVRLGRPVRVADGSDTPDRVARGCGAAGSAPHWQCGGQGFESPQLHPSEQGFLRLARLQPSAWLQFWLQLVRPTCQQQGAHAVRRLAGQRRHHRLEFAGEAEEVAVVHAAVIELGGKVMKQPRPVLTGWLQGKADRYQSLDDVDWASIGCCGSLLFPGTVPAGGRTPLRDGATPSRRDRTAAPSARRGGGPSGAASGRRGPSRCGRRASRLGTPDDDPVRVPDVVFYPRCCPRA